MTKTKTEIVYIVLIVLVVLVTAFVLLFGLRNRGSEVPVPADDKPKQTETVIKEVERIVEVEKTITSDTIQDGLNDMGLLVTQQYFFTEVVSFSSVKKLFNTDIALKFTESSYLASYDGTVNAGIDFEKIKVEKDENTKHVTVLVPKAEILNIDIDPNSFELYSEKTGISNALSVEDFNQSLIELEDTAKSKAIERGIIDMAEKNAEAVISNFISSLVDKSVYSVEIVNE